MSELLCPKVLREQLPLIADDCAQDWEHLRGAKVLVTGGTGYFGSWLLLSFAALNTKGYDIEFTVMSRDPDRFIRSNPGMREGADPHFKGLKFIQGDVVTAEIPKGTTHVFHLATSVSDRKTSSMKHGQDPEMEETIGEGTRNIVAKAVAAGVKRLLLTSSGAIYGQGNSDRPHETDFAATPEGWTQTPLKISAYGRTKREAEAACLEAATKSGLEVVIARAFAFSGALLPMDGPYALSDFFRACMQQKPIQIQSPQTIRTYLDGRDLVSALWGLMARGQAGEAYNVGSEQSVTMAETAQFVRTALKKVGVPSPDPKLATQGIKGAADAYRPNIDKIRTALGWSPKIRLEDSLYHQARWLIEEHACEIFTPPAKPPAGAFGASVKQQSR